MEDKIVIGFVGMPGSGKTTALESITDLGKIVTMGDVVRNETKKRGLEMTPENLAKVSKELHDKGGGRMIAAKCVEIIKNMTDRVIFVDGLRSQYEVDYFRKFWKFPVVAIICDDEKRYQRLLARKRRDDKLTLEGIIERDKREIGYGMGELIEKAEYKIDNNSDIEDLIDRTRKLVLKLIDELSSRKRTANGGGDN